MGITNANKAAAQYQSGTKDNPLAQKMLMFEGLWGEVSDPAKTLDDAFDKAEKNMSKDSDNDNVSLVGSPKEFKPEGFDGALMKCQDLKVANDKADGTAAKGPKEFTMPVCIWADYSTVGIVMRRRCRFGADGQVRAAGRGGRSRRQALQHLPHQDLI